MFTMFIWLLFMCLFSFYFLYVFALHTSLLPESVREKKCLYLTSKFFCLLLLVLFPSLSGLFSFVVLDMPLVFFVVFLVKVGLLPIEASKPVTTTW